MANPANESIHIQRALVQKLESLYSSGVRTIPRTNVEFAAKTMANATVAQTIAPVPAAAAATVTSDKPAPASNASTPEPTAAPVPPAPKPAAPAPISSAPVSVEVETVRPFPSPILAAQDRAPALQIIADEVSACTRCPELVRSRKQTVFGVGNPNARLVFFGEAPGADEDRMGEPFVGKAGQLLTKIIEACTLSRDDVYIMNVLRCRPPGNRNPAPDEAQNCRPFFEKQFEIIRPEFICCLGSIAATTLLNTTVSVGRLRGKLHDWRGMKVAVTYHPAYLLRNAGAKKHVWADMKMLMKEMGIEL